MGVAHCVVAQLAEQIKQLSNPVSLAIICVLHRHRHNCEKIGLKRLAMLIAEETGDKEMSQPGVSHRLRELSDAGLLHRERRRYSVATGELRAVVGALCNYTGITQGNNTGEPEP